MSIGRNDGFTLIEVAVTLLLLVLLAAYAAPRLTSSAALTLDIQADLFARHLRHAQSLAQRRSVPLQVVVSASTYEVRCGAIVGTCTNSTTAIIDPATGAAFSVSLTDGAGFSTIPATIGFDRRGNPVVGTTPINTSHVYVLSDGALSRTVRLLPLGGLTEVAP